MSIPAFLPPPSYSRLKSCDGMPLHELCKLAGVACAASGDWIGRKVLISRSELASTVICRDGSVIIGVPVEEEFPFRFALGVMAYSVFDGVAKQSIRAAEWRKVRRPDACPHFEISLDKKKMVHIM